jgi:hypothetical protein
MARRWPGPQGFQDVIRCSRRRGGHGAGRRDRAAHDCGQEVARAASLGWHGRMVKRPLRRLRSRASVRAGPADALRRPVVENLLPPRLSRPYTPPLTQDGGWPSRHSQHPAPNLQYSGNVSHEGVFGIRAWFQKKEVAGGRSVPSPREALHHFPGAPVTLRRRGPSVIRRGPSTGVEGVVETPPGPRQTADRAGCRRDDQGDDCACRTQVCSTSTSCGPVRSASCRSS